MIGELNSCHKIYIASFMPINSVFGYYINAKCIKIQAILCGKRSIENKADKI